MLDNNNKKKIKCFNFNFNIFILARRLPDPVYCPNNCGRCYRGPGRKGTLNSHLKYECGGQRNFSCSYCSKSFSQKRYLKTHCALRHKIILNV